MSIYEIPIGALDGADWSLDRLQGQVTLIVNVASRCGLTPQYTGLEALHERYAEQGFGVLGVPCNQFGGQEPGTPEEIATFCAKNYGVTFPMTEKIEVNGAGRHPLYEELTAVADSDGEAGDVKWNFEKFLIDRDGRIVARFRPGVVPESEELVSAVEGQLAG
jgi:glutathione peroxidase